MFAQWTVSGDREPFVFEAANNDFPAMRSRSVSGAREPGTSQAAKRGNEKRSRECPQETTPEVIVPVCPARYLLLS